MLFFAGCFVPLGGYLKTRKGNKILVKKTRKGNKILVKKSNKKDSIIKCVLSMSSWHVDMLTDLLT